MDITKQHTEREIELGKELQALLDEQGITYFKPFINPEATLEEVLEDCISLLKNKDKAVPYMIFE